MIKQFNYKNMFPRKPIKQNKLLRLLLKAFKIYGNERNLNVVNPDYKNQYGNVKLTTTLILHKAI